MNQSELGVNFAVGEEVTYYPRKLNQDDNRHWPATVLEIRRGRYLVEILTPPTGKAPRHLAAPCSAGEFAGESGVIAEPR